MKKIMTLCAVLSALVCCTKINVETVSEDAPAVKKIPVTLTASLGGEDTKLTIAETLAGFKGTWDAEEAITVVSLDGGGYALAYDLFTSSGKPGRRIAEFTGELTETGTNRFICYYPAMHPVEQPNSKAYASPEHKCASGTFNLLYVNNSELYTKYFFNNFQDYYQYSSGDMSHISDFLMMVGIPTFSGGKMSVDMKHVNTIFKLDMTLPESSLKKSMSYAGIEFHKASGSMNILSNAAWGYIYGSYFGQGGSTYYKQTFFHAPGTNNRGVPTPSDCKVTAYIVCHLDVGKQTFNPGETCTVSMTFTDNTKVTKTFTFKEQTLFKPAEIYTISATLE